MTKLTIEDRLDLAELALRGFWLIDQGRAGEAAALFAEDANLTFGPGAPRPGTISGAAIAAAMAARQAEAHVTSRHVLSNTLISALDDGQAEVRSLLTLFRSPDADLSPVVRSVADVIDVCVQEGAVWKIADRSILPVFQPG